MDKNTPPSFEPELREKDDPTENVRAVPYILILIMGAISAWAFMNIFSTPSGELTEYGDQRTVADLRPPVEVEGAKVDGKQIYSAKCIACHQASGNGVAGVFPPLAASEWVLGDEKILTHILLHGVNGEMVVKGVTYKGAMPAWKTLSDDELAAVLTYIRSDWGNTAAPIKAQTIKLERETTKDRTAPYEGGLALKAGS